MICPKKLISTARKWRNLAAMKRRRTTLLGAAEGTSKVVDRGHFVVYTSDGIRFVIPLDYLKNDVFQELLKMAEEEYGLQNDGPIRLPFKATVMEYIMSLIDRCMSKDSEEVFLMSISYVQLEQNPPQLLVY